MDAYAVTDEHFETALAEANALIGEPYLRDRNGKVELIQPAVPYANDDLKSPKDFFSNGRECVDTYAVTDDVTDEHFETALAEAKAENSPAPLRSSGEQNEASACASAKDRRPARSAASPTTQEAPASRTSVSGTGKWCSFKSVVTTSPRT